MTSYPVIHCSKTQLKRENKINQICRNVQQFFMFSEWDLNLFETLVNKIVIQAENGSFKQYTVNCTPLRNKYFFGEGYTYGSQMPKSGLGMEKLYPKGAVDPIPTWIKDKIITPLVEIGIIRKDFINCVTINDYQPGGCIVSHIDPPHIFDRPIVSLSLFSDSALCFGCKFDFKPIRCSKPILRLKLPRGVITSLSGFAANGITHCVRPEDVLLRRTVIVLRRVHPFAPRLPREIHTSLANSTLYNNECRSLKIPKELSADVFVRFYKSFKKKIKCKGTFGGVCKSYRVCNVFSIDSKRYSIKPYTL